MTENMKKYLELISKDEEAKKKLADYEARLKEQSIKDSIAYAAEKGITLTEADFAVDSAEMSDDELDAVAGGGTCYCAIGGGGTSSDIAKTCACVVGGGGDDQHGRTRCVCALYGDGAEDGASSGW